MATNTFARHFKRTVRLGRLGVPIWALAVALLGIAAVAGQALGPVLAGRAGGNAGVVASQNLFFTNAIGVVGHAGDIDQAAANIDTAGLIVNGAFRMHRGDDESTLIATIENRGQLGTVKSAELRITRPTGMGVDLFTADPDIGLAQKWSQDLPGGGVEDCYLVTVEGEADGDIEVLVRIGTADPLGTHPVMLHLMEIP